MPQASGGAGSVISQRLRDGNRKWAVPDEKKESPSGCISGTGEDPAGGRSKHGRNQRKDVRWAGE